VFINPDFARLRVVYRRRRQILVEVGLVQPHRSSDRPGFRRPLCDKGGVEPGRFGAASERDRCRRERGASSRSARPRHAGCPSGPASFRRGRPPRASSTSTTVGGLLGSITAICMPLGNDLGHTRPRRDRRRSSRERANASTSNPSLCATIAT
jgi:hypothetical protein